MSPQRSAILFSVLLATTVDAAPRPGLTVGKPQTVAEAGSVARPAAAHGEGAYLVVWREGWPGSGGAANIRAARLEPGTLRRRDREAISICTADEAQDAPRVAYRRGVFLVVWQDFRSGKDFDIFGALVDAKAGRVIRKDIAIATGSGNQVRPATAETDEGFLVVWQDWRGEGRYGVSSRRVSSTGELLGARSQNIADLGARPVIARSAGNLLVSWVTGTPRGVTSAALLDSKDGAINRELKTIIPCCQNEPAVAGDGRGNFTAVSARAPYPDPWGWGGPGAVVCARVTSDGNAPERALKYGYRNTLLSERKVRNVVDAASWGTQPNSKWKAGAVGGFPGTHDGLWPRGWPAVAYAGDGLYLFAWVKGKISHDRLTLSQYDIWLRGMDGGSLEVRLPDLKAAGKADVDETRASLVTGPAGELLLVYEEIAARGPRRIVARRLVVPASKRPDLRAEFLELCEAGYPSVEKQARATKQAGRAYYWDSYLVRALAVAYDMTGKEVYLEACKRWSDRMIEHQEKMIPEGAYYMQYGRKPGEDHGNWYVADCSSIALGVLATAARSKKPAERDRYLRSVESFAKLVADNFVRPSGGVTDGYWPKSDKEWWCSTGTYGSLAFCLYDETGKERYLKIALGAIDWLNQQDLLTVAKHFPAETIKPTVMMYCLEAYSAGLRRLRPGTKRRQLALAQLAKAYTWMSENWAGRAGIDYVSQWGSKFGGLPFHIYVSAEHLPEGREVTAAADQELRYIATVLKKASPSNQRDQLALFAMMSYAERLSPGAIYRRHRQGECDPLRLWAVDDAIRINPQTGFAFEDSPLYPAALRIKPGYREKNWIFDSASNEVRLAGARNEVLGFQLQIESQTPITGINVEANDLRGPAPFPVRNTIHLFKEWYIEAKEPSHGGSSPVGFDSLGPGWYPDPLIPLHEPVKPAYAMPFDLPDKTNGVPDQKVQGIWVDIWIPRDQKPGIYTGALRVRASEGIDRSLALRLTVFPFTLSDENHLGISLNDYGSISPRRMPKETLWLFYQICRRHRCVLDVLYNRPKASGRGTELKLDWEQYDASFAPLFDGRAFTEPYGYHGPGRGVPVERFYLPFETSPSWAWPAPPKDLWSPEYEQAVKKALREFERHFLEKGWTRTKLMMFYNRYDESGRVKEISHFARLLREAGLKEPGRFLYRVDGGPPKVVRGVGLEHVGVWCVNGNVRYTHPEEQREIIRHGGQIWIYSSNSAREPCIGAPYIDTEALALRTWGWIPWKYRNTVTTMCEWGTFFHGKGKRWRDPRIAAALGGKQVLNGDAVLIYPGEFVGLEGPVPCIRLKALRRGSQDYEYLWLLAQRREDKSAADAIVNRVLFRAMHEALKKGQDYWKARERDSRSHDPAGWDRARLKLAELISKG